MCIDEGNQLHHDVDELGIQFISRVGSSRQAFANWRKRTIGIILASLSKEANLAYNVTLLAIATDTHTRILIKEVEIHDEQRQQYSPQQNIQAGGAPPRLLDVNNPYKALVVGQILLPLVGEERCLHLYMIVARLQVHHRIVEQAPVVDL